MRFVKSFGHLEADVSLFDCLGQLYQKASTARLSHFVDARTVHGHSVFSNHPRIPIPAQLVTVEIKDDVIGSNKFTAVGATVSGNGSISASDAYSSFRDYVVAKGYVTPLTYLSESNALVEESNQPGGCAQKDYFRVLIGGVAPVVILVQSVNTDGSDDCVKKRGAVGQVFHRAYGILH